MESFGREWASIDAEQDNSAAQQLQHSRAASALHVNSRAGGERTRLCITNLVTFELLMSETLSRASTV